MTLMLIEHSHRDMSHKANASHSSGHYGDYMCNHHSDCSILDDVRSIHTMEGDDADRPLLGYLNHSDDEVLFYVQ